MPFLLVFMTLHFLLSNAYDFKTTKNYTGDRDWSLASRWTFREFNELPHAFDRRLEPSYEAAESYLKLFGQSELLVALAKLMTFVGGAIGGVLVALGILNDAILLHVQVLDRNLLWYAGISGLLFTVGKSLLPPKEATPSASRNLFQDMDDALKHVSLFTHHYPDIWKGRGWDKKVHSNFSRMVDSKVKLFLQEIISVLFAPYILCVLIPKNAEAICEFTLACKASVAGAGDVCGYSTFLFDQYGDETWEGQTKAHHPDMKESLAESILRTGNVEKAIRDHPKPRAREGKMEKSFLNFKDAHPGWVGTESGRRLLDTVEEYKQAELTALTREREYHVDAAARQLETLRLLAERDLSASSSRPLDSVPAADAGAGSIQPQAIPESPQRRNQQEESVRSESFSHHESEPYELSADLRQMLNVSTLDAGVASTLGASVSSLAGDRNELRRQNEVSMYRIV